MTLRRPCLKFVLSAAAVGLGGNRGLAGKYTRVIINNVPATANSGR